MRCALILFWSSVSAVLADGQSSDYINSFSSSIALGIFIVVLGCTIDNVGITLQKLAHRKQQIHDQDHRRACYCADLKWTCGMFCSRGRHVIPHHQSSRFTNVLVWKCIECRRPSDVSSIIIFCFRFFFSRY